MKIDIIHAGTIELAMIASDHVEINNAENMLDLMVNCGYLGAGKIKKYHYWFF